MVSARNRVALVGAAAAAAACVAGCGDVQPLQATPTVLPTAGTTDPAGAMTGFLTAAGAGDNQAAAGWLATPADTNDLGEIVKVYDSFGLPSQSGLFWAVAGDRITAVNPLDSTHATVTLSNDIVWCLGAAANDPAATCAAVNGVAGGAAHTYSAVAVAGKWKVDVDINRSSQLDHNPQGSPTASAPTPTP